MAWETSEMKIRELTAIPLAIPVRQTTPPSPWIDRLAKQILVRAVTDDGRVGWGECFAYGAPLAVCEIVHDALAPLVVGQDATRIEPLMDTLQRALMIWGRRGLAMCAVSGVDLALWDLAGKARGVPVATLLGGAFPPSLRVYASLPRYPSSTDVGRATAAAAARGFGAVKLHQTDVESVAVAREAVGDDVELMLDTNCPWTVEEAIRMGRALEPYRLRWLEEPVWPPEDYAGLARVRAAVGVPIACGENEATAYGHRAILAAGAADVLQPSVTKVGGLSEMRRVAVLAAAAGVTLVPHCFYYGPGMAATLHLAAATADVPWVEWPASDLEAPLWAEPPRLEAGRVHLPERPGLGADPDPDVLARYPYRREAARAFHLT
jgi:D-galactarolactone cycloisomerase